MEKSSSKSMIKLLIGLLGVIAFVGAYMGIRPGLVETGETLQGQNDALTAQVQQVRDLEMNEATYTQQSDMFEKKIAEIIDMYPSNIREEDVVLYARDISEDSEVDVTGITINPSNLLYALNAEPTDTVVQEAEAEDGEGEADAAPVDSGVDLGILDESSIVCPDYNLYVMVVSYDFTADYADMKSVFARLMSNRNKRNVSEMSMTYDTESGLIIGTLGVNMYYMSGTDKLYEVPDAGPVITGNENVFGTLNLH